MRALVDCGQKLETCELNQIFTGYFKHSAVKWHLGTDNISALEELIWCGPRLKSRFRLAIDLDYSLDS